MQHQPADIVSTHVLKTHIEMAQSTCRPTNVRGDTKQTNFNWLMFQEWGENYEL